MTISNRKVILVEDNLAEAKLTKIAFNEQAPLHELIHCADGEEFIKLLEDTPLNDISYVLLDLNMPRLSGTEVLVRLAQNQLWSRIPIIVFSSSAFDKDIERCYDLGANAYVVKPVEFDILEKKLGHIHAFWGQANTLPDFADN